MIDEKKLIEDIEKEIEFAMKCNIPAMVAGMRQIASVIEEQPKIGEWIPCSERLPETHNNLLICQSDGYVNVGYYSLGEFKDMDSILYKNVIAWQPLPSPYQPKGE